MSSVTYHVVYVSPFVVKVDFLVYNVLRGSKFSNHVESNIFKSKIASYIKWASTRLISLNKKLQDVILTVDQSTISAGIILTSFLIEPLYNLCKVALVNINE